MLATAHLYENETKTAAKQQAYGEMKMAGGETSAWQNEGVSRLGVV